MTGWRLRAASAAAAVLLDRLVGDPPDRLHPVAWFGRAMTRRERRAWSDHRMGGVRHLGAGVLVATVPVALTRAGARRMGGTAADGAVAVSVAAATLGARSLDRRAAEVGEALARGRIDEARRSLPALVGRDPAGLDEAEIARAVVESVAENTVDAVVAPLLWAALGGPVGAAAYRAVNTLDAMVGYRDDRYHRFGWASARADDVANFVPARVGAVVVALCSPSRALDVGRAVRRQAPGHPSPNAGVIEAAFAAALGLRLGGTNRYGEVVEHRAQLGDGRVAAAADIDRARRLARRVTAVAAVALAAPFLWELSRSPRTGRASRGAR
ncbi:MAG: adenosylcobinamide-phosphate synthase CbiB [Actinomycetota bacterium]|nr:adenosylcobinamide-phosphate synthase CbiB [Actinomycetota bacterium]